MSEKKIKDLRINKGLTKQQLIESAAITEDELSFVTDNTVVDVPAPTEVGKVLTSTADGVEWAEGGGGSSLPDQTGNAGKFLTTDGTNASWGDVLTNKGLQPLDLVIGQNASAVGENEGATAIGQRAVSKSKGTSVGLKASAGNRCVAIGSEAVATGRYSTAIGLSATASADYAVQIGVGNYGAVVENPEANTFKFGNQNGNYTVVNADGTIPSARLAADGTTGQVLTKTDAGMEWKDAGGGGGGGKFTSPLTIDLGEVTDPYANIPAVTFIHKRPSGETYTKVISVSLAGFALGGAYFSQSGDILPQTEYNTLGGYSNYWGTIFVRKINNGYVNIDVPTTGGTMVTAAPPTADGNYVLKATVSGGVVTTQWVAEA